jgi:hypothetical protein
MVLMLSYDFYAHSLARIQPSKTTQNLSNSRSNKTVKREGREGKNQIHTILELKLRP